MSERPRYLWDGVYTTFAESGGDTRVHEECLWVDKAAQRARETLANAREDGSVPPLARTADYVLPVVAALQAREGRRLRILDFGGGIAASFHPLAACLPDDSVLDFHVVENAAVCRQAAEVLGADPRLHFYAEFPELDAVDIVHAGSAIHYVDDWQGLLDRLCSYRAPHLILADVPAADVSSTFITTQLYYGRRIPVRFWRLADLIAAVEQRGYQLKFRSRYVGWWDSPPTGNFDDVHRLGYFSQFVFALVDA
jgi:putative methyltransferase (TIGR04325 family)